MKHEIGCFDNRPEGYQGDRIFNHEIGCFDNRPACYQVTVVSTLEQPVTNFSMGKNKLAPGLKGIKTTIDRKVLDSIPTMAQKLSLSP